jgi:cytochrome c peroxidase
LATPAQWEGRWSRAYGSAFLVFNAFLATPGFTAAPVLPFRVPLGLDERAIIVPDDNRITTEKIALGKQLFFDRRWSKTRTVSCSSCHDPEKGWSDDRRYSLDHESMPTLRHAPTIINRTFSKAEGWTGHRETTEDLLLNLPFTSTEAVSRQLAPIREYQLQFQRVFGTGVTAEGVAKAIAAFQRTILSGNSAYDRYKTGDAKALSDSARRGLALFEGKGRCAKCHSGFNFTDEAYHNIGVGMDRDMPDAGRFQVSKRKVNLGAFKTPTLRDVIRRGPYMHDGSLATLSDVIAFYDRGGVQNATLSPDITPLNLSAGEKRDLLAFLESLTGVVAPETRARPVLPQ